jgi:uncharacterized protein related to proFAR isomerase
MRRLIILLAALLTACTHYEPPSLHGAASMRVEVEVYKGPLTMPIEAEVGDLLGTLSVAVRAVDSWNRRADELLQSECKLRGCPNLKAAKASSEMFLTSSCYYISKYIADTRAGRAVYLPIGTCNRWDTSNKKIAQSALDDLKSQYKSNENPGAEIVKNRTPESTSEEEPSDKTCNIAIKLDVYSKSHIEDELRCLRYIVGLSMSNMSTILLKNASNAMDGISAKSVDIPLSKSMIIEYANISSEYGSSIYAKTTSILQLMQSSDSTEFRDPKTLPVSSYLKSTSRSEYLHLYDWLLTHRTPVSREEVAAQDRIRMAQRLAADTYWQKVNEVYASGQGEVGMAFIKDELGNWDLKQFDNDPAELLKSYRDVTNAALKTAARLTAKAASGGGTEILEKARSFSQFANQMATGEVPATPGVVGGVNLAALHDRTATRIADQKVRFVALVDRLNKDIETKNEAAGTADSNATIATGRALASRNVQRAAERRLLDAEAALRRAEADAVPSDQITAAQTKVTTEQSAVDKAREDAVKDEALAQIETQKAKDARAAVDAANMRLKGLSREAVEAVRGTLDDHLAVIAALQDGVASAAAPPAKPNAPKLPTPALP